jgi:hypothetical protein
MTEGNRTGQKPARHAALPPPFPLNTRDLCTAQDSLDTGLEIIKMAFVALHNPLVQPWLDRFFCLTGSTQH